MKRKSIALAAACMALLFAGCQKKASDRVKIRWFVGLGAGSDEPTYAPQKAVVDKFNASQDEIELVLEIVDNDQAFQTLATQISGGNAPDVVGPVGIRGRDSFKGAWLDLDPLVKKYGFNLSQFDESMVEFYRDPDDGLIGLPFGIYPSYLYCNKELFEEAGIPLPPKNYGEKYVDENGKEWTWDYDCVRRLAMKLTVDANGNDATEAGFNPKNIVQWGFGIVWGDARGYGTLFSPGTFVARDGTAHIPQDWLDAWKWTYDGMWKDNFIPTGPYSSSDILSNGSWGESGKIAMFQCHLWYSGYAKMDYDWDVYPMPSYKGNVTAKMHADTFEIAKGSKHPDEAFKVLEYLVTTAADDLLNIYGGMPAITAKQDAFLDKFFKEKYPHVTVNTDVIRQSVQYADNPNHESWMPSFQESSTVYTEFWNNLINNAGLDVEAEAEKLRVNLDRVFSSAAK
ncbi:MAG: extracellular solute-binding protein [Treponema sp.]|nr:extracellular solute-binding protein [Treponema sp.]